MYSKREICVTIYILTNERKVDGAAVIASHYRAYRGVPQGAGSGGGRKEPSGIRPSGVKRAVGKGEAGGCP